MVEFSYFVPRFFFLAALIIAGIIFEKQFIAFEDKFDKWFEGVKENVCKQKKIKSSR